MCLIVVAWLARDDLPLVVAANRDEWRDRPARPALWWEDHPDVLAGRDLKAGGTWMGMTRGGRFAAVTNFRDPSERRSTARSRGELATQFLTAAAPPEEWLASIAARARDYNGFNLLVGDRSSLFYFGSREGAARRVEPGVHALSNHVLDEPWPKVVAARAAMAEALGHNDPSARLFTALSGREPAEDAALPDTGVGLAWERRLATALITGENYGTRCSTVVCRWADGRTSFEERTRDAQGHVSSVATQHFTLGS